MSHTQGVPYIHGYLTACYMPLFFLASGFVYSDYAGSIARKLKLLLRSYLGWGCFYLLISILFMSCTHFKLYKIGVWISGISYSRFMIPAVRTDSTVLLFPHGAAPLWFLTCMAMSYLAFIPLIKANGRMLILFVLLYLVISSIFVFSPFLLPWSLDTAFIGALLLYTGYRFKYISIKRNLKMLILVTCALLYISLVYINGSGNMSIRDYGVHSIWSVLLFPVIGVLGTICYSIFFILVEKSWLCRSFAFLGRMSLTIMCAHMFCIMIFNMVYKFMTDGVYELSSMILLPVRLIFVLLMCVVIHYLIVSIKKRINNT